MMDWVLDGIKTKTTRTCRTTEGSFQVTFTIDWTGSSIRQLTDQWGLGNRVISGQKTWEKHNRQWLMDNVDGNTFVASDIGKKQMTRDEKLALLRKLEAELGINNQ